MKLNKRIIVNACLVFVAAGCATDGSEPKDFFAAVDENRATSQFMNAQINNGVREDPTLMAAHFTGTKLNSLGTEKLTRLVPDDEGADVKVNLDVREGGLANSRRDEVIAFLKNCGVAESSISVKIGANEDLTHPAVEQIQRLPKTETGAVGSEPSTGFGQATMGLENQNMSE